MPISRITGASIEDGSIVIADLGITTFNTGTGNTLTLQANSATGLVIDVTGNTAIANSLSFSATGARIRGDFSNATVANRVAFQTSTTNAATSVYVLPNGTSRTAVFNVLADADPTNSSVGQLFTNGSEIRLSSSITGTGTYLPMTFQTGGSERLRIDTSGNMMLGVTTVSSSTKFDVYGNSSAAHIGARVTNAATDGYSTLWLSSSNDGLVRGGSTAGAFTSELAMLTSGSTPLTFYTGNTKRMTVGATGNIGIGTASPSQLLHVAAGTILASNTSGTTATVSIAGNGSVVGTSDFSLQQGSSSEAYVFNRANSFLVLGTNNTERMRILSGGNVGIGQNTPAAQLEVSTATTDATLLQEVLRVSTTGRSVATGTNGRGTLLSFFDSANPTLTSAIGGLREAASGNFNGSLAFYTSGTAGSPATAVSQLTERMRIDSSGNVGIGTSSPAMAFHVVKSWTSGKATIGVQPVTSFASGGITGFGCFDSDGSRALYFYSNADEAAIINGKNTRLTLWTNETERMRISSGGVISSLSTNTSGSFGDSTPRLYITPTGSSAYQWHTSASADANYYMHRVTNTGNYFFFGYNSSPVGSISTNGSSTSYGTSSDYRLKENVAPMTGALAKIGQLKPCTYKWKLDGSNGQGFIAHELQAVVPECVTGEKDAVDKDGNIKPQGVDTSFLVATLTAAIQEQQAIIESLTARIETLEKN